MVNRPRPTWIDPPAVGHYRNGNRICDPQAARPEFFLSQPIDNIPAGFSASPFPGIDFPAYPDYLNERFDGSRRHEEENFVYNVDEDAWSGYIQANFRTERLRGNVGVRIAQTRQHIDTPTGSSVTSIATKPSFDHDIRGKPGPRRRAAGIGDATTALNRGTSPPRAGTGSSSSR